MFEEEAKARANEKIKGNFALARFSRQGYIDGFQEGAEFIYKSFAIHDLRKDPNDLPKDNEEKLCFYGEGKVVARYDSKYGCWETNFNNLATTFSSSILIAWCEIPKEEL